MSGQLPEGWVAARVPDIAEVIMGQSPPGATYNAHGDGLPFFQGKADFGERHPTVRKWCSAPKKMARAGDILLSVRAPVGPTNVADQTCAVGRGLAVLRTRSSVLPDWLWYGLRLQERHLASLGVGSTFTAINSADLNSLSMPTPPFAEQRRIVAAVEALLARVNAAKERLDRVPGILKRFRQAVLAAACSGRMTEDWRRKRPAARSGQSEREVADLPPVDLPASWTWASVEHLCRADRALTYGVIKLGPPLPGGIPTLRSSDVRLLRIDSSDVKQIHPKIADQYLRTRLEGGEVVVTVRGTLGGVAVVPDSMVGYNVSREVAVLPFRPEFNAEYLALAVASLPSQNWLMERAKGVAYTGINIADLRLLPLPVPSRDEQDEIVGRVALLSAAVDAAGDHLVRVREQVGAIQQAVLAKAFRGELVPTEAELARQEGREYESAEELMARINAGPEDARGGPASAGRRRRKRDGTALRVTAGRGTGHSGG